MHNGLIADFKSGCSSALVFDWYPSASVTDPVPLVSQIDTGERGGSQVLVTVGSCSGDSGCELEDKVWDASR